VSVAEVPVNYVDTTLHNAVISIQTVKLEIKKELLSYLMLSYVILS